MRPPTRKLTVKRVLNAVINSQRSDFKSMAYELLNMQEGKFKMQECLEAYNQLFVKGYVTYQLTDKAKRLMEKRDVRYPAITD